jgi:hypothetical protein
MNELNLQNKNFLDNIDFLELDSERRVIVARLKLIAASKLLKRFNRPIWLYTAYKSLNSFQRWFLIDRQNLPVVTCYDLKYFDSCLTLEEFFENE